MPRVREHIEDAPEYGGTYVVKGWPGVACVVAGWETEPDEDTWWTGIENRTGKLLVVMVGDDQRHRVDPDDLTEIKESEYCHGCGQIGCGHNVPDEDSE